MKTSHILYSYLFSLIAGSLILSACFTSIGMFIAFFVVAGVLSLPFVVVFTLINHFYFGPRKTRFWQIQLVHLGISLVYVAVLFFIDAWEFALLPIPYFIAASGFHAFFYSRRKTADQTFQALE